MRTSSLAVVVVVALVSVSPALGDVSGEAKVRMLDPAPLTLKGVGFAAQERIRLTVSLGERTLVRKLVARTTGTFLVRFPTATYDRCSGELSVKAVGSRGSGASWTLVPLDCLDGQTSVTIAH